MWCLVFLGGGGGSSFYLVAVFLMSLLVNGVFFYVCISLIMLPCSVVYLFYEGEGVLLGGLFSL